MNDREASQQADKQELEGLRAKSKADEEIKRDQRLKIRELKAEIKHYKSGKVGDFVLSDIYVEAECEEREY